jgi:transposase
VDVSGARLDGRIGLGGPLLSVDRTVEGVARLAAFCAEQGVELVAMEATGGLEKLPFSLLWEAGLPCAIVNPRQVRRFAESLGYLEKTDAIDAGVIAQFAQVKALVGQAPASPAQARLTALVVRLRQLTELKVAQANQRRLLADPETLASIDEITALIRRQIKGFETAIAQLLGEDPLWRALDQALREIKGVADRTVAHLMAQMPEIGIYSNKAIAKLAGLAPLARDSGKRSGQRAIYGGRSQVRSVLFVVAGVVARHEPDFIAFRQRLLDAGKPKMVVRIALARKLLVRLNAKAREARMAVALA